MISEKKNLKTKKIKIPLFSKIDYFKCGFWKKKIKERIPFYHFFYKMINMY